MFQKAVILIIIKYFLQYDFTVHIYITIKHWGKKLRLIRRLNQKNLHVIIIIVREQIIDATKTGKYANLHS